MAYVLSSVSGNLISAASAGFAPTNSADVSAIASAYQVVSATATQLYAGTAYVTSVNDNPLSASRAGQAANASMANSAYYDGTGRLISALPDSAAVSAIASSYAASKLDTSALDKWQTGDEPVLAYSGINGIPIHPTAADYAHESDYAESAGSATYAESADYWIDASSKQDALTFGYNAENKISSIDGSALAGGGGGGGSVSSPSGTIIVTDGTAIEATNSAIGTAYGEPVVTASATAANTNFYSLYQALVWNTLGDFDGVGLTFNSANYDLTATLSADTTIGEITVSQDIPKSATSVSFMFPQTIRSYGNLMLKVDGDSLQLSGNNPVLYLQQGPVVPAVKELAWKDDIQTVTLDKDGYGRVTGIDGNQIYAWSSNYSVSSKSAATAKYDSLGRELSSISGGLSGVSSPSGTILISGGSAIEASNSAIWTSGYTVEGYPEQAVGYQSQLSPTSPLSITLPSANPNTMVKIPLGYGSPDQFVSADFDGGQTASAAIPSTAPCQVELALPNATTANIYCNDWRQLSDSASAYADSGELYNSGIGELAWASALSSYVPYSSLEYNTASAISGINGSALAAGSTYSAGEGIDITDDVISVETPVDIVAGPGIVVDNPDGNTLRVSTEADAETVLWENYTFADNKASSVAMSETPFNFSQVRITFYIEATSDSWGTLQTQLIDMVALASNTNKNFTLNGTVVYGSQLIVRGSRCNFNGTSITESATVQWYNGGLNNMSNALHIYRIVGIHRIANN